MQMQQPVGPTNLLFVLVSYFWLQNMYEYERNRPISI